MRWHEAYTKSKDVHCTDDVPSKEVSTRSSDIIGDTEIMWFDSNA